MSGILAVIPARGGSKGVPGKNLRAVGGKPLIAHSIEVALRSSSIARVIVTTDSEEIAAVARSYGADVPFLRPAELATDDTPGVAPILHAVEWLAARGEPGADAVVVLQPTSPLRAVNDVEDAIALWRRGGTPAVVSVTAVAKHPAWSVTLDHDARLSFFLGADAVMTRRQDLPKVYALNGAVYVVSHDVLLAQRSLLPEGARALVMPPERSIDVDNVWDLHLVDLVLRDRDAARSAA